MEAVLQTWRIDDEWWRRPISRIYHEVVLETGATMVIYQDLEAGREEGGKEEGEEGEWYVHGAVERGGGRGRFRTRAGDGG